MFGADESVPCKNPSLLPGRNEALQLFVTGEISSEWIPTTIFCEMLCSEQDADQHSLYSSFCDFIAIPEP